MKNLKNSKFKSRKKEKNNLPNLDYFSINKNKNF